MPTLLLGAFGPITNAKTLAAPPEESAAAATVTSVGTSHASELAKVFGFTLTATEVATGTV
jgi:hypothetical protein